MDMPQVVDGYGISETGPLMADGRVCNTATPCSMAARAIWPAAHYGHLYKTAFSETGILMADGWMG